ncbi:MAG: M55 family metallopeptidase, partial [Thermodesulfobacteriota bacterium]
APGLGPPGGAGGVLFVGLHAAAGTAGFLAHTLTSRLARLEVNGRPLAEIELFSASLAPFGIKPVFISGCPAACAQAAAAVPGITTWSIDKTGGPGSLDRGAWREGLARAATLASANEATRPYEPAGPFSARVAMRDGEKPARRIEKRWGFRRTGDTLHVEARDIHELYLKLIRLAYLTPLLDRLSGPALALSNFRGRYGLAWVRRRLRALELY